MSEGQRPLPQLLHRHRRFFHERRYGLQEFYARLLLGLLIGSHSCIGLYIDAEGAKPVVLEKLDRLDDILLVLPVLGLLDA